MVRFSGNASWLPITPRSATASRPTTSTWLITATRCAWPRGPCFCATSMGVLACCDARDGVVEWARTYPQERNAAAIGPAPVRARLVAGGRVAFLPRDAGICLTLDPANGELGWLKTRVQPAILRRLRADPDLGGGRKLAALELAGGNSLGANLSGSRGRQRHCRATPSMWAPGPNSIGSTRNRAKSPRSKRGASRAPVGPGPARPGPFRHPRRHGYQPGE